MEKISITLREDQVGHLSDLVGTEYADRSKAVRSLLDKGIEYDDLEAENDRLRRQLEAVNSRADDLDALAEYVERERELQREERERRQAREHAPVWVRARWWLFGKD